jgi:hypothetical protein
MINNCSFHFLFVRLFSLLCFVYVYTNAQVSEQCLDDDQELYRLARGLDVTNVIDPDFSCAKDMEQTQCAFDYGPVNTNFTYECTSMLNGTVVFENLVTKCIKQGSTTSRTFNIKNIPNCYAKTCNETEIDVGFETFPIDEILYNLMGLDCEIDENKKPTSSATIRSITNFAFTGTFVLFVIIQSYYF